MRTTTLYSAAVTALLALTACREAPAPTPPDAPPRITRFTVDQSRVNPGTAVRLSYEVEGAHSLELVDDTGAFVELTGNETAGEARVTPLRTHFYILRAIGRGGRDSAFVQVAVGEPLKEVFLVAVPPQIEGGESAQLLWGAFRTASVSLSGTGGVQIPISGESGAETVTPKRNTTYTLVADPGPGSPSLSATVEVRVSPVIQTLTVNPGAAQTGGTLKVSWTSVGGTRVTLSEATFGQLFESADLAKVDSGSFDFTIPATLPNGDALLEGLPLKFKLRVQGSTPDVEISREVPAYVGDAPVVTAFIVPKSVTENSYFTALWRTAGATRVTLKRDGQPIFETLPSETRRALSGAVRLPAGTLNGTYELVASNAVGVTASASRSVTLVKLPVISSFTAPVSVPTPGGAANFQWATQNASAVVLRTLDGRPLHSTTNATAVASGSREVGLGRNVTVQLAAYNEAGDVVLSAPKTVLVPEGNYLATDAGTSLPGISVDVSYDLSSLNLNSFAGIPTAAPVPMAGVTLPDLSVDPQAEELLFADPSNGTTMLRPGQGFSFPFFGRTFSAFHISVDGVLAFNPLTSAAAVNTSLTATGTELGQALAPLWDELSLGANGKVRWTIQGDTFPRKLIVEWAGLSKTGATGSNLRFQVHLSENGEFSYLYGDLTGADLASTTVGVKSAPNLWAIQLPPTYSGLAAGSEITWFAPSAQSGMFQAAFPTATRLPLYGVNALGRWTYVEAPVRIYPQNSLVVTEAMSTPNSSATAGQWLELMNLAPVPVNVGGLLLRSAGSAVGYVMPDVELEPGGVFVVGQSTNTAENDGAAVEAQYSDVPLTPFGANSVTIEAANGVVHTFAWDGGDFGRASQANQPFAVNASADGGVNCGATQTFNPTMSAYGTPGAPNPPCVGYSVQPIPSGFEDISQTAPALFADTSNDDQVAVVPLPVPVRYWGTNYSTAWIHSNGYVMFKSASAANVTNVYVPNATRANAQGMAAPFWDELYFQPGGNVYAQRFDVDSVNARGHYVVQWSDMRSGSTADSITFQLKVFDDGIIEFHYGNLINGSTTGYAYGDSATAWLERPSQAQAVAVNRGDEKLLRPFTSYRFTPAVP